MRTSIGFLAGLLLVALCRAVQAAEQGGDSYAADLIRRANDASLADAREWHLLLHYRPMLWGGYRSEADDPGFFLAPTG
ncbi:MAG: DUF4105 domain-containing protein, partial [Nitrospiraceae bacterium]